RMVQAMHCWTWPNLLFWSIIPEHAPRHSFPLFPGIAGLAALVWLSRLTGKQPLPTAMSPAKARFWTWMSGRRSTAKPVRVLIGMLIFWLVVKVGFVELVIPARNQNREPHAKGERLAALVPPEKTLYLSRLKDEGIMFYYRR